MVSTSLPELFEPACLHRILDTECNLWDNPTIPEGTPGKYGLTLRIVGLDDTGFRRTVEIDFTFPELIALNAKIKSSAIMAQRLLGWPV